MIAMLTLALSLLQAAAPVTPAVTLMRADGSQVNAADVLSGDRRLVVYVAPDIEPGARLLSALRAWVADAPAGWRDRLVVIVAGTPGAAEAWLTTQWRNDQQLPLPEWFADPGANAWQWLGFEGSLAIAGVSNGRVQWKVDGVIGDPGVLRQPAEAWVNGGGQ